MMEDKGCLRLDKDTKRGNEFAVVVFCFLFQVSVWVE